MTFQQLGQVVVAVGHQAAYGYVVLKSFQSMPPFFQSVAGLAAFVVKILIEARGSDIIQQDQLGLVGDGPCLSQQLEVKLVALRVVCALLHVLEHVVVRCLRLFQPVVQGPVGACFQQGGQLGLCFFQPSVLQQVDDAFMLFFDGSFVHKHVYVGVQSMRKDSANREKRKAKT